MKTAVILMLVWYTSPTVPPVVQFQEIDNMDTCRSMSIELDRMINKTYSDYIDLQGRFHGIKEPKYKTFCHVKEIK